MRISVIIPTRKRIRQLTATLISLGTLSSGKHPIQFGVACDDDDKDTIEYLKTWRAEGFQALSILIGHGRPQSLGALDNELARRMPADVYCVLGDDLLCCSVNWDEVIAEAMERLPYGVFWWKSATGDDSLAPIISEKWRQAAGNLFTEHFPYWFDDLWLWELWQFTTDAMPEYLDIRIADKSTGTTRMRDLDFWVRFYHSMRDERVKQGVKMAAALGLPKPKAGLVVPEVYKHHTHMPKEIVEDVERRNRAETGAADPAYLMAKQKAEELMKAA